MILNHLKSSIFKFNFKNKILIRSNLNQVSSSYQYCTKSENKEKKSIIGLNNDSYENQQQISIHLSTGEKGWDFLSFLFD